MKRRIPRLAICIAAALIATVSGALAYFTGAAGQQSAAATVASMTVPGSVAASSSPPDVTVTWTASTVAGSTAATSYTVERYDGSGNDLGAASCSPVSSSSGNPDAFGNFTCTDVPGPGAFEYKIAAHYASWTATSGFTNSVRVTAIAASAPASASTGVSIAASSLSATLSGASTSPAAGGAITFTVFGPQATPPTTCTSGGTAVGTATVSGPGTYNPSSGYTPTTPGTYWWYASYGGDGSDPASSSTCGSGMTSTVVTNATTTSASPPANGTAGTTIAASSIGGTLSGASTTPLAGGTISFTVFGPQASAPTNCSSGGTTVGTATVSGNGTYNPSSSYTPEQAGTYWWYVSYGGDTYNSGSTSTCGSGMASTTVAKASPTTTAASPAGGTAAVAIGAASLSATLSSTTTPATGTVTFYVFGPQSTAPTACTGTGWTNIGTATVTGTGTYNPSAGYTPQAAGTYWWYASYDGDANNNASNSTCGTGMTSTVVGKANPTMTAAAPATDTTGNAIAASSISATLSSATSGTTGATGTVTFFVFGPQSTAPTTCTGTGWTDIGTATVSGPGTYTPSAGFTPNTRGDYWWYVSYNGDTNNNASNSSCGTGMTSTTVNNLPTISASGPSTGTAGTAIATSAIGASLNGISNGDGGTITFTVFGPQASPPTDCTSGGTTIGTATVSGKGTYHPSATFTPESTAGNYYWYASYSGYPPNFDAAVSSTCGAGMPVMSSVAAASPTLTVAAPSTDGTNTAIATSSITATLSGATNPAGGTITFKVFGPQSTAPTTCTTGGTTVGSTVAVTGPNAYNPTQSYTPSATGTYWWYASYTGDSSPTNNNPATSTCGTGMTSTVVKNATTLTVSAAPQIDAQGTAIAASSVSATLSGATSGASGTITFTLFGPQTSAPTSCTSGGTTVGTATVSGNGTYHPSASYTPPAGGTYWWYVSYNGDTNNFASNSTCGTGMSSTNVWGATPTASATTTSGSSSTTSKFTVAASTTYLLMVYRHSVASDGVASIASTNITPALTTSSFTLISSNPFNSTSYEWAYWLATSGTTTGTAGKCTITVTFNKTLGTGQDTVLSLVAVSGNDATNPVVTTNVAAGSGAAGTAATANLPNATAFGDVSVVWLGGAGALGTTAPAATGLQSISYVNNTSGSAGLYGAFPAQQNSSFGTVTPAWGTIAFEMQHG